MHQWNETIYSKNRKKFLPWSASEQKLNEAVRDCYQSRAKPAVHPPSTVRTVPVTRTSHPTPEKARR